MAKESFARRNIGAIMRDLPDLHILSLFRTDPSIHFTEGERHDQIPAMVLRQVPGRISAAWCPVFKSGHGG